MAGHVLDHLRKRLVARRLELGLTQAEGAAFAQFDQGSMSKFERGQLGADVDTLSALATGYGTSLKALLDDGPEAEPDPLQFTGDRANYSARLKGSRITPIRPQNPVPPKGVWVRSPPPAPFRINDLLPITRTHQAQDYGPSGGTGGETAA